PTDRHTCQPVTYRPPHLPACHLPTATPASLSPTDRHTCQPVTYRLPHLPACHLPTATPASLSPVHRLQPT
ncbi:hypothetical protein, partial [Pseudomonas viridiflava]